MKNSGVVFGDAVWHWFDLTKLMYIITFVITNFVRNFHFAKSEIQIRS